MFNNVFELINYVESLKKSVDEQIDNKKKILKNKCEACNKNNIEVIYKSDNLIEDIFDEEGHKMKLNVHLLCEKCYRIIILSNQLSKSSHMIEIDRKLFGEEFDKK